MDDPLSNYSGQFRDALLTASMIDEMARADNWQGLDECLAIKPEVIKTFAKYADAALRAVKRMETMTATNPFSDIKGD